MAADVRLNNMTGGDKARALDRGGTPAIKTQVVVLDLNTGGAETISDGAIPVKSAIATQVDGHSANIGLLADADTASTLTGLLKKIKALLNGGLPAALAAGGGVKVEGVAGGVAQPVSHAASTQADGHSANIGATTDADTASTLTGLLKKIKSLLPAALAAGGGMKVEGVAGGVAQPTSNAAATQADGHSANIGLLADADSASTLTGLLKKIKALLTSGVNGSGTKATWVMQGGFIALAQNKLHFDLFNATGSGVILRVRLITFQKDMSAQTGVAIQMNLYRTTSVGTGGTSITPVSFDSGAGGNAALPAGVTARFAASGGAGLGDLIASRFYHSEETNVAAQMQEALPFWPPTTNLDVVMQDIVLRENQGLTLKQITTSTAGTYNTIVEFTVE